MTLTFELENVRRVLGFDFGLRRIGVAVGQRLTRTASPAGIVLAVDGEPNWKDVKKVIADWRPDLLLVGLPLNMDDSMSLIAVRSQNFAKQLEELCQLPVVCVDERLSTFEAKSEFMRVRGLEGIRRGQRVDAFAAVILVEAWLNEPV